MWDGVDRRQRPRAEYPCLITVRKEAESPVSILTHTKNISEGGVRVIVNKEIGMTQKVDLEIDLMDTLPTIIATGTVKWVKTIAPTRSGKPLRYDLGIQFFGLQSEDKQRIKKIVNRILGKGL